jgi:tetratricopeptide (TPR) repeat protein
LLDLAKHIATSLGEKELAKKVYGKAEQRVSSGAELRKLAQAIVTDLGDEDYAAQLYSRTAEKLTAPNDLMNLAGDVAEQLDDKQRAAEILRKALTGSEDFAQLMKLLDSASSKIDDKDLAREILEKAESVAKDSPMLVEAAKRALDALSDGALATRMLEAAEERVTSVGEMRSVNEMVKSRFAENSDWVSRVAEKLQKREANQAKYAVFQARENTAQTFLDHLKLADSVLRELEDTFYARKLLIAAEKLLKEQDFSFTPYRELAQTVAGPLGDTEWATRLLSESAERAPHFAALYAVARTAVELLPEGDVGKSLARGYYQAWATQQENASSYDFSKLAEAVHEQLGDVQWAGELLDKACATAADHFALAHIGALANRIGNAAKAADLFARAVDACSQPSQILQLATRLRRDGADADTVRSAYAGGKARLTEPAQRLTWAEGILQLFRDKQWAAQEYDELAGLLTSGADQTRYKVSRKLRLEERL